VIGTADDHFVRRVLTVVKSRLDESMEPAFSSRSTSSGRHVSVTVEPDVNDAGHVLEIYRELQQVEGLVMLF
jgi:putative lipoic acid-binding regulatory protein